LELAEGRDILAWLPPRPADSHKGDFGRLAVIAGSRGKAGAAVLTARGALRAGAGLVTVFCPASVESVVVSSLPEAMTRGLPEEDGALAPAALPLLLEALGNFDAAVAGPGLGTARGTVRVVEALAATRPSLVLDADALNAFAGGALAALAPEIPDAPDSSPGRSGAPAPDDGRQSAGGSPGGRDEAVPDDRGDRASQGAGLDRRPVRPRDGESDRHAPDGHGRVGRLSPARPARCSRRIARGAGGGRGVPSRSAGESLSRSLGDAGLLARARGRAAAPRAALRAP
jgi:hypothetical protein